MAEVSEAMSPRTGRPPKGEESKPFDLQVRITPSKAVQLQRCANALGVTRTEVVEKGIDLVEKEIEAKKQIGYAPPDQSCGIPYYPPRLPPG